MPQKIFVLAGHPYKGSLTQAMAHSYKEAAERAGYEVRIQSLSDMTFDPVLHKGYTEIQDLEPDLERSQEISVGAITG